MSNSNSTATNGGISLGGLLFIIFLVLKLTGLIDWSWVWVTSPLWAPLAVAIIGVLGVVVARALTKR
jgi:hypothetical protein